jgi:hypothetical protein
MPQITIQNFFNSINFYSNFLKLFNINNEIINNNSWLFIIHFSLFYSHIKQKFSTFLNKKKKKILYFLTTNTTKDII